MTAKNDATPKPRAKAPRRKARPKKEQKVTEAPAPTPEPATAADTAGTAAAQKPTPATPKSGAPTGLTIAAMAEGYLAHLADAGKGRGTQFSYSIDLDIAIKHFGTETDVGSLTERKVTNFFEGDAVTKTRSGKPKAQPTIDKTRRVLRQALLWAAESGHIETAPLPEKPKRARKGEDAA